MAASIVVDIKAQITGYQEQIAKIQQALSKIKIDSSLGKELTRELENAQKILNNLGKNTNVRLGSESGIDQLTDRLENAGEKIRDITQLMGQVKFEDLDVSKLGPEFTDILKKVQELQAALDQGMGDGIQKSINDSETLKKTFTDLGADITKISADSGLKILNTALKDAQEEAANAKAKVEELNGAIEQQSGALQKLEQNPFFANSFNLDSLIQQLTDLGKVSPDKILDKDAFQNFINTWKSGAEQLPEELDAQKQKINEILSNLAPPATIEGARQQFENLSGAIRNILSGTGYNKDSIFGGTTGTSFVNNLFKVDNSVVNEAKAKIENIFNTFRNSFKEQQSNKIQGFLDNNEIQKAAQATIIALRDGQSRITAEYDKLYNELDSLVKEKDVTEIVQTAAETNVTSLTQQISQLEGTIDRLKQQFEKQEAEITSLKQQLAAAGQKAVEGIQEQAKNAGDASANAINQAKEAANMYKTELQQVQAREQLIGKIEGVVQRWFSIYAAVRMVGQAIRSVISTVQELDKTITEIAIVTDMTQDQLWGQMKSYTDMARQYAASISGVYEVSQLYYQQGLQTADVMALTEETLKMARISGLDYATATDYMTNAVRSFKMEMTDAQTVVDVYSEIAASSATDTAELATAMSKTASSAEAVGSSFENTTAMMAVMIEATRESAENIGSAMKSIISRYGEMTADPSKITDSEGEAMSLNKVDKALQTVGISIHDAAGQFRDFDDVITELAGKWDTIDKNTQRYIATVMAGNRQQSRFLALVSNGERLAELSEKAANSQDAATLQVLKTMDSIEAKTQQLKTSLQSLYTSTGVQNFFKGILDLGNNIIRTFTQMPTLFNLPILAIIKFGTQFYSLANIVITTFEMIKNRIHFTAAALQAQETDTAMQGAEERINIEQYEANRKVSIFRAMIDEINALNRKRTSEEQASSEERISNATKLKGGISRGRAGLAMAAGMVGSTLSLVSAGMGTDTGVQRAGKGLLGMTGSLFQGAQMAMMMPGPAGIAVGALTTLPGIIEGIATMYETAAERAERLANASKEASNTYLQNKSEYTDLQEQIEKLKELEKARNDSKEANEAYLEVSNTLANSYPELISYITQEGNAIVDLSRTYDILADARLKAQQAAIDSAKASAKEAETNARDAENDKNKNKSKAYGDFITTEIIEGSNKDRMWKDALGEEYDFISEKTNYTMLNNAKDIFSSKYFSALDQDNNVLVEQYDLLYNLASTISTRNTEIIEAFVSNEETASALKQIRSSNSQDALIQAYFSLLDELTGDLLQVDADINRKNSIADVTNRSALQQLNYWQGEEKLENKETEKSAKFLKEFDGVSEVIDNYVFDQFKTFKDNFTGILGENDTYLSKFEESGDYQEAYDTIYKQLEEFYNNLKTEAQKQNFNDLLASRGQYSPDQFRKILKTRYANMGPELFDSLMSYYDDLFDFSDFIKEIDTRKVDNKTTLSFGDKLSELNDLSSTELQSLLAVYDNISEQIKNNLISPDLGQEILNSYSDIWTATNDLDPRLREIAQSILTKFDDFSLTGIDELYNKLEMAGIDPTVLEKVDALRNIVPINLNTEIQSLIDKTTGGLGDFEKALSSSSKGMDFKSAAEIAAKAGKSVQEAFDLRDGKLFIKNVEDIQKAYLGDNSEIIKKIQAETKKVQKQYLDRLDENKRQINFAKGNEVFKWRQLNGGAKNSESLSVDEFTDLVSRHTQAFASLGFSPNDLINYYTEFYDTAESASSDFLTWVSEKLGTQMEDATKQLNAYVASLTANAALQAGDYQSFVNTVLADVEGKESLKDKRDEAIKLFENGDLEALYDRFPAFAQTISETYSGISEGIYNKLLSESLADKYVADNGLNTSFLRSLGDNLVEITTDEQGNVIYKLKEITEENIKDYFSAIDNDQNLTDSQKAAEKAKGTNKLWNESVNKLLQDVYKNVDSVNQETYEKLISEFGLDAIKAISKVNGDNTYIIDASGLQQLAQERGEDISEATLDMGENAIQKTSDDILKQLSTATSLVTKGNFSPKEMQNFVTEYEKVTGQKNIRTQDIFNYDSFSKQFKLSSAAYNAYIEAEHDRLMELWNDEEAVTAYIDQLASDISYNSDASNGQFQRNATEAAKDIIAKRTALTEEEIKKFADFLGLTYEQIKDAFTSQGNGYYTADIEKITNKMVEAGVIINDFILEEVDTALAAIRDNSDIMESGFSDIGTVMTDFNNLKALTGEDLKFDEIYTIDPILHKYVYTANGLITANNTQIKNIAVELEASNAQLSGDLQALEQINELVTNGYDSSTEEIIAGVASKELYQAYQDWLAEEENFGKHWKDYYKERSEQLQNQIENNEILEESLPELKEANKQIQFEKIDFKGIASGTVKFATAYNQFYNYLIARNDADGIEQTTDELEKEAEELAKKYGKGGKAAAEQYKINAGKNFSIDVYNDILNQPVSAAQSLFNKLKDYSGNVSIQLTEAEAKFLKDTGIIEEGATSVSPDELSESYQTLMKTIQEGLKNGSVSLQAANQIVADHQKTEEEKNIEYADAIVSTLTSGKITTDSLNQLASSLNVSLKEDFDINNIRGISTNENNVQYIDDVDAFIESLAEQVNGVIDKEKIKKAFDLADKSKLNDSIVSANNSVIETLANNINSLKNAEVGKQINLTYLQDALDDTILNDIFGDAYSDGILTVNEAIRNNMFNNLQQVRMKLEAKGKDTSLVDRLLSDYISNAQSAIASASVGSTLGADVASVLVAYNTAWSDKIRADGTLVLQSAQEYISAASNVYQAVHAAFDAGTADLQSLNNSYVSLIQANLTKETSIDNMLSSATNLSADILNNFMTTMGYRLEKMLDVNGDLINGWAESIERTGTNSYQIKDWDRYIVQLETALGYKLDKTSKDYINSYIAWLDSEANVAPNAKEALMATLIPNLERLSYAQIGQIARTFGMTVDAVLALVENNGDNTFNANALYNSLDFNHYDADVAKAYTERMESLTSSITSAILTYTNSERTSIDSANLGKAMVEYRTGMRSLGEDVVVYTGKLKEIIASGGADAVEAIEEIAKDANQQLSAQDVESLYRAEVSKFVDAIDTVTAGPGAIVDATTAAIINDAKGKATQLGTTGQYIVESTANLYLAYNNILNELKATNEATLADINKVAALALENKDSEQQIIDALGDAASMTYTRFGEILAQAGYELSEKTIKQLTSANIIKQLGGNKISITDFSAFADLIGWDDANSEEYVSAFKTYNDSLIDMNRKAERNIIEEVKALENANNGDWINLTQLYSELTKNLIPDNYNGNVDLKHRPIVDFGEYYETILSTTKIDTDFSENLNENELPEIGVVLASITQDGIKLTEEFIDDYAKKLFDEAKKQKASGDTRKLSEIIKDVDASMNNLLLEAMDGYGETSEELIEVLGKNAEDLHERQAEWYGMIRTLNGFGATIEDGVLKIDEKNTNIPAIMNTLIRSIESSGKLLGQEEAELLDALNANLESYSNALSAAIEGTASNIQMQKISDWAKNLNIQIDFKKTTEGLKLSEKSARELYLQLKKVDNLRANLVFDKLDESLKKSNEHYKNIFTITSRIAELNKKINNLEVGNARRKEYEEELEVAKEIQEIRSLTDPDTFNFMDQDLPDNLKGADNFWKSARKAYVTMNQAGENGYMAFQDWYNLANFIEESAITAGTTIEFAGRKIGEGAFSAADLIESGAKALANVDDEGSVVSFERLGTSFKNGAQDMSSDFDVAIKTTANAQIKMLDTMIAMLETVVAFDKFNELDTDFDGLEFDEIFVEPYMKTIQGLDVEITKASDEAAKTAKEILKQTETNKDLKDGLEQIKVDGITLYKILGDVADQTELSKTQADKYYKILAVWAEAAKSGDYSTENLTKIIQDTFAGYEGVTNIEVKGRKFVVSDNIAFEADETGNVTFDGKTYSNADDAIIAYKYKQQHNLDKAFIEKEKIKGTIQLKDKTVVTYENDLSDKEAEPKFIIDNIVYNTKEAAVEALYKKQTGKTRENGFDSNFNEWLYSSEAKLAFNISFSEASAHFNGDISKLSDEALEKAGMDLALIYGVQTAIERAVSSINIAQLFIDGLTTSLEVTVNNGQITFTNNPAILALGANLGQGIAYGVATASSSGISNFFSDGKNQATITDPIKTGLGNAANSATVTDTNYEISHATATLKKMEINQVEEAGFSSSILGNLIKGAKALFGGNGSDLILESATASVKKLSLVNVDKTELKTQLQAEIDAKVGAIDVTSIDTAKQEISAAISEVSKNLFTLTNRINSLNTNSSNANVSVNNLKTSLQGVANSSGPSKTEQFKQSLNTINQTGPTRAENFKNSLNEISNNGSNRAFNFKEAINGIANYGSSYASNFVKAVNSIRDYGYRVWNFVNGVNSIRNGGFRIDIYVNGWSYYWRSASWAKGNVALSKGNTHISKEGPALANGTNKTLMGELGPELVVSNGKYYVVGQNGAEMVSLPSDAIVFNHLQTQRLLNDGKSSRGKPVTNEKNAVSYATGNISGPALVSATQALASLKQLRAMWQSMLNASAKQLGSQAGKYKNNKNKIGGSGTGGSGSNQNTTADDGTKIKTTTAEIQRWYNLLRQIDKTEKDITYEEKLQTQYQSLRVADGKSLYESYKKELSMLEDQIDRSKELAVLQKSWYDTKRAELAASAYGKIFTYTEDGLQQYVSGANKGLDILEKLTETDIWGNPKGYATSAATQLSYLQSLGFNLSELLSNSDGTKVAGSFYGINDIYDENGKRLEGQDLINAQVSIMENFWDNIDGWRDELDGLYDSYREQLSEVIDNQNKQNELMQKVVDNQIEVENKVYNALVDARQTIIDNAKKELDAYKKNSDDMINSLNKTLSKERELYNNQKNSDDLLKLQRQLAILQRSGGSTSQILSLQQQIANKQQDMYFNEKEEQIKALQEASNLQINKMEEQIEIMNETLEYQKNNGLLWGEVASIMNNNQQNILEFIVNNAADWGNKSTLQLSQDMAELQTKIQVYIGSRDDEFIKYYDDISSNIKNIADTIATRNTTITTRRYKKGGLIDFTGPAWVDGTSSEPESILNASETKFVQNNLPNILNNVSTLQERQMDLQDLRSDWLSSISYIMNKSNNQNSPINIERIELNMQVEQMSNSADARKLGKEAFDELLSLARKAGNNSVSRR